MSILTEFAKQAKREPDVVAVIDGDRTLTYGQIAYETDRLAHRLGDVAPGNGAVGYLGWTNAGSLVATLATLKSGRCIVALNPDDPARSITETIRHAGIDALFCMKEMLPLAIKVHQAEAITVFDPDAPPTSPFEVVHTDPNAPALIKYTSGTTGLPKGALNTFAGLENRWKRHISASGYVKGDVVATVHANRLPEQLALLTEGIRQEFLDVRKHDPDFIRAWLHRRGITKITVYLNLFRKLFASRNTDQNTPKVTIQDCFVIGEPLTKRDFVAFNAAFAEKSRLIGRYSSSEHGPIAQFFYRNGDPILHDVSPIGDPLEPDTIRIIDEDLMSVDDGQVGELAITSNVISGRYHNDAERSVAVFVSDPANPGRMLYRTGDLAYRNADGLLIGLGRKDQQVKIRGVAVRPPEVEELVIAHPDVSDAAVVAYESQNGVRRLACHFEAMKSPPPDAEGLRAFLMERVPNYQVPSLFIHHPALPRTATGKVNRAALPDPLASAAAQRRHNRRPYSAIEQAVSDCWQDLLNLQEFGPDEDFFDLGGDSLLAMTMLLRIERAFGGRLPLESLFVAGATVSILASEIARAQDGRQSAIVELKRGRSQTPLFALHVAGGHLSDYLQLANGLSNQHSLVGIGAAHRSGDLPRKLRMEDLAVSCADAIAGYQTAVALHLVGFSFGAKLAFETARQLRLRGRDVGALVMLDPPHPTGGLLPYGRKVVRSLRKQGPNAAFRQSLSATGVIKAGTSLADLHDFASLSYWPKPQRLPRILLISAVENRRRHGIADAWRRLVGGDVTLVEQQGDHMAMIDASNAFSLARKIEAWLAKPEQDRRPELKIHEHEQVLDNRLL